MSGLKCVTSVSLRHSVRHPLVGVSRSVLQSCSDPDNHGGRRMYCTCGANWCEVWNWCSYARVRAGNVHGKAEDGAWGSWVVSREEPGFNLTEVTRLLTEWSGQHGAH